MVDQQGRRDVHDFKIGHIFKQHSIYSQWLILNIALIVIGSIVGLNIYLEYERTESREAERLISETKVLQENIVQNLIATRDVLVGLRQHFPKGKMGKGLATRLQALSDALPGVRIIGMMDASGAFQASNRPELIGKNFRQRDYFRMPQQQPDRNLLYITPPFKSIFGVFTLNASVIIPGSNGDFAGVITASLDPHYFAPLLDSVRYASDMRTGIIHWNGDVFMIMPEGINIAGKSLATPGAFFVVHKDSGQTTNVFNGATAATGEGRMVVFYTAKSPELKLDNPLVVIASRDPGEIFLAWRKDLLKQAGMFVLIILLSVLAMYAFQRRQRQFNKLATEAAIALKQSEERFKAEYQGNPIATFTWQKKGADFEFIDFNKAAYFITAGNVVELVGKKASELYADQQEMLRDIHRCFLEKEIIRREIKSKHFLPGRLISINIVFVPADLVIIYSEDITERREAEEKLVRFARELERSNKELDDFAYIASHDLKEPLRGIHNYSSFLLEDYADLLNEDGKDKLKTLVYLTKRLEGFINDLLKFSRVGRVTFTVNEVEMDEAVQDALSLLKPLLEKENVRISIPKPLPSARCDYYQIVEVFQNLISNAVKYNDKQNKSIEIGSLTDDNITANGYIFYVRDNGIGIDKKYFDSIFTIFKRLHARDKFGGGTGAGLTIVKKIIERHGGRIWLESIPAEGTTFYFTLQGEKNVH